MTATVSVISGGIESNLDQLVAQGVEGVTGLMTVPGKRGENLVVPGAHGQLHVVGKRSDAMNLVLPLWVRGVNPDGTIPAGTDEGARIAFHARVRAIVEMFAAELVTIRHTLSDGTARDITGEVTDVLNFTVSGTDRHTLGQVTVGLNVADPFWRDLSVTSATLNTATGIPTALPAFAGASAPMEDLLITFGPQSNPRITQLSTGVFVAVNRVVAAGQTVVVDTATWQVFGTGGVAPRLYEDLEYGGRGTSRWFALHPQSGGPIVRLDHTGGGTGSVTVAGRRKHKIL